ncbi:hypothetical protein U1Q18_021073 [Sarracenia purpurea var. burkii]
MPPIKQDDLGFKQVSYAIPLISNQNQCLQLKNCNHRAKSSTVISPDMASSPIKKPAVPPSLLEARSGFFLVLQILLCLLCARLQPRQLLPTNSQPSVVAGLFSVTITLQSPKQINTCRQVERLADLDP